MSPWPDLRPILGDIPWVIVGGVATRAYMPERATKDLDFLVRWRDGDEVRERLEAAGYHYVTHLAVPGFLARSPDGVDLDDVRVGQLRSNARLCEKHVDELLVLEVVLQDPFDDQELFETDRSLELGEIDLAHTA